MYTYGVLVSVGFIAGYLLLEAGAAEEGVSDDHMVNIFLLFVVAAIVGARAAFVLSYPQYFATWTDVFRIWQGGLTVLGGSVCCIVCVALYARRYGLSVALILDLLAPSVALGYVFGRLGCLGFGCCYGLPTTLPWGVVLPNTDPSLTLRHPTQVYSSLAGLATFLVLRWYRRRPHADGMVAVLWVYLYSGYRVAMESMRGDVVTEHFLFGLTLAQSMCLVGTAVALAVQLFWLRGQPRRVYGERREVTK